MVLLAAYVLVSAIGFGLYLADHRLLGRAISDPASVTFGMALAIERHATTLAFLTVALVLATVVLFISWLWRSYDNVHAFGVRDPRFARGWTIGAWFVPVLNLVRPKQLVDDTWRGSMSPAEHAVRRWRTLRIPWPLHAWWAAWLVGGLLWRIGDVWYEAADGLEALRRATPLLMIAELVGIVAALLAIWTVLAIDRRQTQAAAGRPAGRLAAPRAGLLLGITVPATALGVVVALVLVPALDGEGTPLAQRDSAGVVQTAGAVHLQDLHLGDCFTAPTELWSGSPDAAVAVHAVPCTEPHDYEAFEVIALDVGRHAPFPGDLTILEQAETGCVDAFEARFETFYDLSPWAVYYLVPIEETWAIGDRQIVCVVGPDIPLVTGAATTDPWSDPSSVPVAVGARDLRQP